MDWTRLQNGHRLHYKEDNEVDSIRLGGERYTPWNLQELDRECNEGMKQHERMNKNNDGPKRDSTGSLWWWSYVQRRTERFEDVTL